MCISGVSINEKNKIDQLVFPNPTNDYIFIQSDFKIYNLEIYDALGNQIKDFDFNNNTLNVKELSNGLYFIIFSIKGNRVQQKFIKN